MQIFLPAKQPFSLHSVIYSHGWAQLLPFQVEDEGGFSYIDRLASGRVVAYRVTEAPGGVTLEVDANLDEAESREAVEKVRWMLGLDMDMSVFYVMAHQEPKLAEAEQHARGRVLRSPTLFEDIVKTILTTNTQWGGTKRMVRTLVEQFGSPHPAHPARIAFPTPEQVAPADADTLRNVTRLGYRAPFIQELSRAAAESRLDLAALRDPNLPTPELRKRLLAIKGVGGYAAANLLMLLGRYDAIPIDSWAMKMVSQEWHGGQPVGPAEVEAAFARFGEWKGLAYWFWQWDNPG